ncbi:MAG: hypothetical protein B9S34_05980 [Opitutia bacterium Tous-C1TDCM]|nr:MAG: hypothetical protein B9S34_05980 [Opitutae bacterium Tous-C1TDCM]
MPRLLLAVACLSALLCAVGRAASAAPAAPKPNIVFILADDYGIGEVGCYGADHYKTPNIDALAAGGMRFTRGYTVPLCGPSRAQILTGRYGFRNGATNQDATREFTTAEKMIPAALKPAGYVASMVGKWGQLPLGPAEFGFDDYLKFNGSGAYWNTQTKARSYLVNGEKRELPDRVYLPDVMHDHIAAFLAKNRERPFFLFYSLSHVHTEILPTPDSPPDSQDLYGDNVRYMDKLVGKLVAELEKLKLRERTLIVFLGDNGTGEARSDRATIGGRRLAGAKGDLLEGGALVPLIVNFPGLVPAGTVNAEPVDSTFLFPTFAALAGAPLPAGTALDGENILPALRGARGTTRGWAFNQLARQWWARDKKWKLNQAGELFDMSDAPFSEKLVPAGSTDAAAVAARARLAAVLAKLNPAGGVPDRGPESGRHAKNAAKREKKQP